MFPKLSARSTRLHTSYCLSLQFHCILGCNLPNEFSVCWRLSARITRTIIIAWVAFFVYLIYDTITGSLRFVKHFSSFHSERARHGEEKKNICALASGNVPYSTLRLCSTICYTLECRCNQAHSFCSDCDRLLLCLAERFGAKCIEMCARRTETMRRSVRKNALRSKLQGTPDHNKRYSEIAKMR